MRASAWWASALCLLAVGCERARTPFTEDPTVIELRHPAAGEEAFGNFVGRIPCATCEKLKVVLSLFQSTADHSPSRYQLERVGEDGDARLTTRGRWTRGPGRAGDPNSATVTLDDASPAELRRFLALDGRVLLTLDAQGEIKLGNGAWSYTLDHVDIAALDALTP